ncbi:hypothetical protein AKJ16_DCAP26388 [Drosera capensis]
MWAWSEPGDSIQYSDSTPFTLSDSHLLPPFSPLSPSPISSSEKPNTASSSLQLGASGVGEPLRS